MSQRSARAIKRYAEENHLTLTVAREVWANTPQVGRRQIYQDQLAEPQLATRKKVIFYLEQAELEVVELIRGRLRQAGSTRVVDIAEMAKTMLLGECSRLYVRSLENQAKLEAQAREEAEAAAKLAEEVSNERGSSIKSDSEGDLEGGGVPPVSRTEGGHREAVGDPGVGADGDLPLSMGGGDGDGEAATS